MGRPKGYRVSLPWDPKQQAALEALILGKHNQGYIKPPVVNGSGFTKKKPRRRQYSGLRTRPPCAACGHWKWIIVTDHALYRDPFLECFGCKETFRMDLTPLDMTYAWRDQIPMPDEVKNRHASPTHQRDSEADRFRAEQARRAALERQQSHLDFSAGDRLDELHVRESDADAG